MPFQFFTPVNDNAVSSDETFCWSTFNFLLSSKMRRMSLLLGLFLISFFSANAQNNPVNGCFSDIPDAPYSIEEIINLYSEQCSDPNIDPDILLTEKITGDDCAWEVTYTYTIKCGEFSETLKFTYEGGDDKPPALDKDAELPTGETGMNLCYSERPSGPSEAEIAALFIDNCGQVNVSKSTNFKGNDCSWKGLVSYEITDDCGNAADDVVLFYSGGDMEDPVFESLPEDFSVACADLIPAAQSLGFTDNCVVGKPKASASDDVSQLGLACEGGIVVRTWTATDECGNTATHSITITVDPAPEAEFEVPDVLNVKCEELDSFTPGSLSYSNGVDGLCNISGEVTGVAEPFEDCCGSFLVNYSFTDECGRTISASQEVIVTDDSPPTFDDAPQDEAYQCIEDVPEPGLLGWSDDGDGTGTVLGQDSSDGQTCPETITRTWTYTDECGNTASVSQIITVNDTTAPEFEDAPADATYQCAEDVPAAASLTWTDNCDVTGSVLGQDVSDGQSCPEKITRTWTYTDECGNSASVSQIITVNDTTAPEFKDAPSDASYQCPEDVPVANKLTWTDNCDGTGQVDAEESTDGQSCPETITRTWTYTDECGNTASVSQIITVNDTTAPEFEGAPADITLDCSDDIPAMIELDWTDNCDGSGKVLGTDSDLDGACGTIIRTWTYTDKCGNSASVSQKIIIEDNEPPVIVCDCDIIVGNDPSNLTQSWLVCHHYNPMLYQPEHLQTQVPWYH